MQLIVESLYVQHLKHDYKMFKFFLLTSSHNAEVKTIRASNAFFIEYFSCNDKQNQVPRSPTFQS